LASGTQKEFDWGRLLWSGTTGLAAGLASAAGQWSSLLHACFAAGTPILTPEGYKFIEDLRPGDLVLSRDENDPFGEVVPRVVEEVFQRTGRVLELTVGGRVIRTSDEHPFWVRGKGWTEAVALEVGDELSSHDGRWLAVEAVEQGEVYQTLYNLRVAEYHTYFVGCAGWGWAVWAHNMNCFRLGSKAEADAFVAESGFTANPRSRGPLRLVTSREELARISKTLRETRAGKRNYTHVITVQVEDTALATFRATHQIPEAPGHPGSMEIPQTLIPEFNRLIQGSTVAPLPTPRRRK
jgi:hypothetical protein